MERKEVFLTVKQAAKLINRTPENVSYLLQYNRIHKYDSNGEKIHKRGNGGLNKVRISKTELLEYIEKRNKAIHKERKDKLGEFNEDLTFDDVPEKIRTKHVHRLHQYKGKFIPQLVDYFLEGYFDKNDLVLDPFMGSGTTLVQANEMGIRSVGIDITPFNCMIAKVKTREYDIDVLKKELNDILSRTKKFSKDTFPVDYEKELKSYISEFNKTSNLEKRTKIDKWIIDRILPNIFLTWSKTIKEIDNKLLKRKDQYDITENSYLQKWFALRTLKELQFYRDNIEEYKNQDIMKIILTRSARSSRLVHHFDLATPKNPVRSMYYCFKHKQICYPIQNAINKLDLYTRDSINRIEEYSKLRKDVLTKVLPHDDARFIKMEKYLDENVLKEKFDGIFTSPPYVGNIDYHEQHRYAYELLNMERFDEKEIGPKSEGKSKKAKQNYIDNISQVLINLRKYMKPDADIFIVANDQFNLYEDIALNADMQIIKEHLRPVSNRTERDKGFYSETIFHMKYI